VHLSSVNRLSWMIGLVALAIVPVALAGKGGGGGGSPGGGTCGRKCDTTPPTVSIATPTGGATIGGTFAMSGAGADNVGVTSVHVQVDNGAAQLATGTTTWTDMLDTKAYTDGTHQVRVTATDAAGNVGSASVSVSVSNQGTTPPPPDPAPTGSCATAQPVAPPGQWAGPGTIGGYLFRDCNRDGAYTTDEQPLAGLQLYLFDAHGAYLATTVTQTSGWYVFGALPDGQYTIRLASPSWYPIRTDWVPDTTGSAFPVLSVSLAGTARADMGWRKIVRSSDLGAPISSYLGTNGLTVQSYDDVVSAKTVFDHLMTGSLVGIEARYETIRFDYGTSGNMTSTGTGQAGGVYDSFSAVSYLDYSSWLDTGDDALFHEYGHAWSKYYASIVQQDPTMSAYLKARGLYGDPRIGTSYAWDPDEMIAEDYRELFGDANAQAASQMNRDIPSASQVPGLKDFFSTTFLRPPS